MTPKKIGILFTELQTDCLSNFTIKQFFLYAKADFLSKQPFFFGLSLGN